MTVDEARQQLRDMLAPVGVTLTDEQADKALAGAVTPDPAGRWPQHPDWVPSWCLYWAAATICDEQAMLQAVGRPGAVTRIQSEGTTLDVAGETLTDWGRVAAYWRGMSPLAAYLQNVTPPTLGVVDVPSDGRTPYTPTSTQLDGGDLGGSVNRGGWLW